MSDPNPVDPVDVESKRGWVRLNLTVYLPCVKGPDGRMDIRDADPSREAVIAALPKGAKWSTAKLSAGRGSRGFDLQCGGPDAE